MGWVPADGLKRVVDVNMFAMVNMLAVKKESRAGISSSVIQGKASCLKVENELESPI